MLQVHLGSSDQPKKCDHYLAGAHDGLISCPLRYVTHQVVWPQRDSFIFNVFHWVKGKPCFLKSKLFCCWLGPDEQRPWWMKMISSCSRGTCSLLAGIDHVAHCAAPSLRAHGDPWLTEVACTDWKIFFIWEKDESTDWTAEWRKWISRKKQGRGVNLDVPIVAAIICYYGIQGHL